MRKFKEWLRVNWWVCLPALAIVVYETFLRPAPAPAVNEIKLLFPGE